MVAESQGLFFISSPHEGGNKNPFLKCYVFENYAHRQGRGDDNDDQAAQ
jgi:hypothetical protein